MTLRFVGFVAVLTTVGAISSPASAQSPTSTTESSTALSTAELGRYAADLSSPDERVRAAAVQVFLTLEEDSIRSIAARVQWLAGHRPVLADTIPALSSFRRALGSRRADDDVDMARGVLPILRERRDATIATMAEPVLLLRTLERIGTVEALKHMTSILSWDGDAWQQETRRIYTRLGARLLPLLINPPPNPNRVIRRWIPAAARDFHLDNPSRAVQQSDARLVADILLAYGNIRRMDAMRVIASFLGNERVQIREASRVAIAKYGRNAIWVLRQAYENMTGREADLNWGTERTMREVVTLHDQVRLGEARTDFDAGMRAKEAGNLEQAVVHFDAVLLKAPSIAERTTMADVYASYAAAKLAQRESASAVRAYRRALWLAPDAAGAASWERALAFLVAESQLSRGVADLHAYQHAAAETTNQRALEVVEQLTGEAAARARLYKKVAAGVGALLLLGLAWRMRKRPRRKAQRENNDHDVTSPGETPSPV